MLRIYFEQFLVSLLPLMLSLGSLAYILEDLSNESEKTLFQLSISKLGKPKFTLDVPTLHFVRGFAENSFIFYSTLIFSLQTMVLKFI